MKKKFTDMSHGMDELLGLDNELLDLQSLLQKGNELRIATAKECAKNDAPVLGKTAEELEPPYTKLFMQICTDQMLETVKALPAKERYSIATTKITSITFTP